MRRLLPVALLLAGLAVYANSFGGVFLFDDLAAIPDNPSIRQLWPLPVPLSPPARGEAVSGRPLVNLSLAMNYAAGGLNVAGYHAVNLALHLAIGLLLFAIVRRTTTDDAAAFACALLWLVHPLQSEVVNYTVARTESLMALCLMATLYCAIRTWTAGAIAVCAAGMACKETMVVAPLLVALYDRRFQYRSWREAWRARKGLWTGLAATWLILFSLAASMPRAHSAGFGDGRVGTYALNQTVMIARYLRLFVWPVGLVLDYGFPRALGAADVVVPLLLIAALAAVTGVALVRHGRVGFLGLWFFLTLAPSSSIIPVLTEVGAERRMYLPSMALTVLVVFLAWSRLRRRPAIALAALVGVATGLGALTLARNREYRSALTMWQVTVERWPRGRARVNYAAALQTAGRTDEMTTQLRLAVADYPEARYDAGAQLVTHGEVEEGLADLEQFVRDLPTHPNAAAARDLITRTRTAQARRTTDEAIAFAASGRPGDAVRLFRRVVELLPDNANAHRNLANALLDARDYGGAAAEAREALRLNPTDPVAKDILASASRPR